MAYRELNETTILAYAKTRAALVPLLEPLGEITASEVGDGNLNTVYILESVSQSGRGIVIKQALPYLRILGEDWKLTRERIRFETESLRLYNEHAPGLAPAIYDYDDEMSLVAMEYLSNHLIMRKALVERQRLPHFADHISTFLANTLFYTSDLYLTGLEKKTLQARFI
ncbi:MAG TPA: S-methyl-5-thioribose kinase, partial [Caldilineaceae bacterium]|nr:S-methyl-5-thioribose kinase [Caldilineaceae bacterium]